MTRATSSFIRPLKSSENVGSMAHRVTTVYRPDIVHHNQAYDGQGMGLRAAQLMNQHGRLTVTENARKHCCTRNSFVSNRSRFGFTLTSTSCNGRAKGE